ncbi:hypothetical protein O0L34_g13389 [Tuta absoluta]|nr:hypothetical protein O0L34_g13389 [Tuta absoluta]
MQQAIAQGQLGQSPQMVQQSSLAQAQQQMAQSQITQQQLAQNQLAQHQIAQQQHMAHQQQQQQLAQSQLAQQQIAQSQIAQQQMAQTQIVQQQIAQSQMAQQQPQILQQQLSQPQMIQQQLAQQQISQQQLQQMMYCPTVRLVYDTPMQIMQSGDQIQQQNQNIFVNQPPWARPVQNQVIYVQQIGNNLVPVQHLDPNMFLQQNIPMYQQVVQNVPQLVQNLPQAVQSIGPQGQIRQIINNIPTSMVPNFGTNIQRIQDSNLGQMVQNFGVVQQQQQNNDVTMNNVANNEVDRQNVTNQVNVQQNPPTQEVLQVYRQIVPQINQQQIRTQVPVSQQNNVQSMQPGQQIITNMGQTIGANIRPVTNVGINTAPNVGVKVNNVRPNATQVVPNTTPNINQIIRTSTSQNLNSGGNIVATNVPQVRHIIQAQNINIVPQSLPQNLPNTPGVAMQSYATSVGTLNTVTYSAVRNGQPYTYRAIQPKPNSNNVRPNFKPRGSQMPPNVLTNTIPTSTNYMKMETDTPTYNRKRKSESPDEIHKKISNYGSITVTAQVKDKIKAKCANTSEMGTNTSPVHKMHKVHQNKVEHQQNQLPLLQINPMEAKIKKEYLSPTGVVATPAPVINNNANIPIKMETDFKDKKDQKDVSQQTEEKLVRKTVFPQAKSTGRLLDAKAGMDMPKIDEPLNNINIVNNETLLPPRINYGSKINTNVNDIQNESNKVPQTSCKQNMPFENKDRIEDNKTMPSAPPITKPIATIVNAVTGAPVNIPAKFNKPSDKKVETKPPPALLEINSPVLQAKEKPVKEIMASQNKDIKPDTKDETTASKETVSAIPKTEKLIDTPKTEPLILDTSKIPTESDFEQEIKDSKIEKKEYKNISINEMKGKEIHMVDGNIHKEEKDFVLTHVLDGFVIQESNVPFAIRRPLKEKTVNAFVEDKNDPCIKAAKEEIRGHILELSQLHLNESKEKERIEKERLKETEEEEEKIKEEEEEIQPETKIEQTVIENDITKDNPFENLKQSEVKTWMVEDLVRHLAKYNWNETVSLLQEHEIDGESLFLVTKTQLMTIGLNESHAEVICDFVGSK